MLGFVRDAPPFARLLPHHVVLDPEAGIVLLETPLRPWYLPPRLAVGCAWEVTPRNCEVLEEAMLLDLARTHEHLLRSLPLGSSFQVIMQIGARRTVEPWEALRAAVQDHPVVQSQLHAIRAGLPHQDGQTLAHMRTVRTLVTVRVPVPTVPREAMVLLRALLALPGRSHQQLLARVQAAFADSVTTLGQVRRLAPETLRGAGHQVDALDGAQLGQAVAQALDPREERIPLDLTQPLRGQVLSRYAQQGDGGFVLEPQGDAYASRVLTLHAAPSQTYPGILCLPRAPGETSPLAVWQAWGGPLTVVTNVAISDPQVEEARLRRRLMAARWLRLGSVENQTLVDELEALLKTFYLRGGHIHWGRIHLALWGVPETLDVGMQTLHERAKALGLTFVPEAGELGATLWLQTLPLGFDQGYPWEWVINRARHLTLEAWGQLLLLFGAFRGTRTPADLGLNQRGETVYLHAPDATGSPHRAVKGSTGAGKTFFVSKEVQELFALGRTIVLVDPLENFRDLCAMHDGMLQALDLNAPPCFNPFFGPPTSNNLAFANALLGHMMRGSSREQLTVEETGVLSQAVRYARKDFTQQCPDTELTLTPFVQRYLADGCFTTDAVARRVGRSLGRRLLRWIDGGEFSGFVDGVNTFAITPGLTVIETGALSDYPDLQSVVFFGMTHTLWQLFRQPVLRYVWKHLYFDEVWAQDASADMEEAMKKMIRTSRNLRVCATFLSHLADDFETAMGRVLGGLAGSTLFLQHEANDLEPVERVFHLSPRERVLLRQARLAPEGWSALFVRMGHGEGGMVRIVPDRLTTLLVSQDATMAKRRAEAIAATGGDVRAAMVRLMAEDAHG